MMSDIAIRVENLSKLYHIGELHQRHDTLRDALTDSMARITRIARKNNSNNSRQKEDAIWALKDVSFEVKRGEVVGIIGRNGAGKSTLLKILTRITEPTSGRAVLHGRVGSLLEVGTGFHPELTGRENIYLSGALLGMHKQEIERRFDEIVDFSGVEKFIDTPVKRYSSGMYVRLGFAVAAHLDPEILLVDEVLAVGDAQFQKKCLGKMGDVAKEGRTVLFVSHNMVAVQSLCGRAFLLDEGEISARGGVKTVVATYLQSGLIEGTVTERIWEDIDSAPGNETVRLRRIAVRPENGKPGDAITMQTPIRVEVEYWNLLPGEHLHTTLHVNNDHGIIAFTASDGFEPDPNLHLHPPMGLFLTVCHIPRNLLNSGYHYITLLFVRNVRSTRFNFENVVGFEVIDSHERTFTWYGKEPGVVQPYLQWETKLKQKLEVIE